MQRKSHFPETPLSLTLYATMPRLAQPHKGLRPPTLVTRTSPARLDGWNSRETCYSPETAFEWRTLTANQACMQTRAPRQEKRADVGPIRKASRCHFPIREFYIGQRKNRNVIEDADVHIR